MQSLCPKRERGAGGRKERGKEEPLTFTEHLLHASHGCGCWQRPGWKEVNERREAELMGFLTELSSYSYFLGLGLCLSFSTFFLSLSLDVIWSWLITSLRLLLTLRMEAEEGIPHLFPEGGRKTAACQGHGRWGEDAGNLQALLEEDLLWVAGLPFTGHGILGKLLCFIFPLNFM